VIVKGRSARQARNEALHREVNERLAAIDKQADAGWAADDQLFEFVCECGAGDDCDAKVQMRLSTYETVRQQDDRFAVFPGHEIEAIERVVERGEGYVVVDKVADLEPFVADDPRGAPSR
jgi:hypothetical protein